MLHYHYVYYLVVHWGSWLFLLLLIIWFALPNEVPDDKIRKEVTLFLLKKRMARGHIGVGVKKYEEK
jgi:hypothetical protein